VYPHWWLLRRSALNSTRDGNWLEISDAYE
jgi:hypothetical protein